MDIDKQLLDESECQDLALAMQRKYSGYLNGRTFAISTRLEEPGVAVQVLLHNADDSFHYPVEARILPEEEELSVRKGCLFLIDYIDLYFEEYLTEDEDLFIPIDWANYQYEAVDFQMRGQILNLKVETMADQLLRSTEDSSKSASH